MPNENKFGAVVKIMRSHDYCHFEVSLNSTETLTLEEIDAMRKEAARLVDKAVGQYKVAKKAAAQAESDAQARAYLEERVTRYLQIPESERSPEQQAAIKQRADTKFQTSKRYDYDDDLDDEIPW